jgi:pyruvyltransferase
MKIYYWRNQKNFGDLLNTLLIDRFTHLTAKWAQPKDAELTLVGSILHYLPHDWGGVIAGSGKLREESVVDFPNARILGLRGPLTAKGVKGTIVLGDPGLLANELVGYQDKKYELGVIPHWSDNSLEHDSRFSVYNPLIIRVSDDPLKVIREIGSCKKIVSSALHGIILADAFGIPRRIEIPPRILVDKYEGGLFKWHDYSASINMKLEVGLTQEVNQNIITNKQHELYDLMQEIRSIFKYVN